MFEPTINVTGNVSKPPLLRKTAQEVSVIDFSLAVNPRKKDLASGTWYDGETIWFKVEVWRTAAENVAASLKKGDRVMVAGRLKTEVWTGKTGEPQSSLVISADSVGLELSRSPATSLRHIRPAAHVEPILVDEQTGEVLERESEAPEVCGEQDDQQEQEPVALAS